MIDTDRHWDKWGREDPYFGVLAEDRFRSTSIADSRGAFLETGRVFIADLLAQFERQFGKLERGRALDHGCGVGRLTLPLADHFSEVVALDVSAPMLAEAERNAAESGKSNIRFLPADDQLSGASGQFDFVNSFITLQHVPVRRGLPIFFRLIDRVKPGGGFHLHVSFRTETLNWRLLYWASANVPGVKIWQNICAGRAWNAPAMQMNNYPLARMLARLAAQGITDLKIVTEHHPRFTMCSLLGRKPG